MSSPHRHPRTGVCKFRKRVPERLRGLLARCEITISLGTKDPQEGRRLHAEVAARIAREWAALTAGPVAAPAPALRLTVRQAGLRACERGFVDGLLEKLGMILEEDSRPTARRAMVQGVLDAQEAIARRADGDWSPDPAAAKYPPIEVLGILDWSTEFDRYANRQSWRKRIGQLMATIGSDDLRKLGADHVGNWKADLIKSGLHPNTVRNDHLAAVKALCALLARRRGSVGSDMADVVSGERRGSA